MKKIRPIPAIIFCIYIAGIMYLCFARPDRIPQFPESWLGIPADKVGHFLMFSPFPLLGMLTLESDGMSTSRKLLLLAVLVAVGFGTATGTEQIQALLEYRTSDNTDLMADGIGLCFGAICSILYIKIKNNR